MLTITSLIEKTKDLPEAEARVNGVLRGGYIDEKTGIFYFCGLCPEETSSYTELRLMIKPGELF